MDRSEFRDAFDKYKEDLQEVSLMADEIYEQNFSSFFQVQRDLASSLKQGDDISDSELQDVLISAPLKLFEVSESLNRFRLSLEVLRTRIKSNKREVERKIKEAYFDQDMKITQSELAKEVEEETAADDMLIKLYEFVIKRVENEMSYSKELIMSAKKIFTARSESIMPVAEVDEEKFKQYEDKKAENDKYTNLPEFHV